MTSFAAALRGVQALKMASRSEAENAVNGESGGKVTGRV